MTAADRLRLVVRAGDTVARLGGDEFAILLEGTHAAQAAAEAVAVAERIEVALHDPATLADRPQPLAASIGIAVTGGSGRVPTSPAEILQRADQAMSAAKARGGGQHAVAAPTGSPGEGLQNEPGGLTESERGRGGTGVPARPPATRAGLVGTDSAAAAPG